MRHNLNKTEREIVKQLNEKVGYNIDDLENFGKIQVRRKIRGVAIHVNDVVEYLLEALKKPAYIVTTGDMIIMRAYDTIFVFERNNSVYFTITIGPHSKYAFFKDGKNEYQVVRVFNRKVNQE